MKRRGRDARPVMVAVAVVAVLGGLVAGAGRFALGASDGEMEPHPAAIHRGRCGALDPTPAYALTDVGMMMAPAGTPAAGFAVVGAVSAIDVAVSVTTVGVSLADLDAAPHAIAISRDPHARDVVIACGDLGGHMMGNDLYIGLREENGSGFDGIAWLRANGTRTTVTIFLAANPRAVGTPAATAAAVGPPRSMELVDVAFKPNRLTIQAETPTRFALANDGALPHNFRIDALGVNVNVAPGGMAAITISAPPGDYDYYCDVPGHKEAGMVGVLTVRG